MLIIIGRLAPTTTKKDITEFLSPALKWGFFFKAGTINSVSLVSYSDSESDRQIVHGLVRIEPDSAAVRVIRKLHRKRLNNMRVNVREYQLRSWYNDKRLQNKPDQVAKNRRKKDRRQHTLEVLENKAPDFAFVGDKKFHRHL